MEISQKDMLSLLNEEIKTTKNKILSLREDS